MTETLLIILLPPVVDLVRDRLTVDRRIADCPGWKLHHCKALWLLATMWFCAAMERCRIRQLASICGMREIWDTNQIVVHRRREARPPRGHFQGDDGTADWAGLGGYGCHRSSPLYPRYSLVFGSSDRINQELGNAVFRAADKTPAC